MNKISIAIDGPSGAGKSTLARMTAKNLGFIYVDTGAIYRTVGLYILRCGVNSKDETGVTALLPEMHIEMRHDEKGMQRMFLNGEDITDEIRSPVVSLYASDVSAMVPVRDFLMHMQREMAEKYNVIMDGRDIGTVVLPSADLKIFLTASSERRAQRRYLELINKSVQTTFDEVLQDMNYRDENDSSRKTAPLVPAKDAIVLDTNDCSLEASIELLRSIIKEKLKI